MLFIMLFFCSNYAKKIGFLPYIMLNYSKLCLKYALHQKYISLNTAGQNKCLFCRNPYISSCCYFSVFSSVCSLEMTVW